MAFTGSITYPRKAPKGREDMGFIIFRGQGAFTPAAYVCLITRKDAWGRPYTYDVLTHYGHDGRLVRATLRRWALAVISGKRTQLRSQHLPSGFAWPRGAWYAMPPFERDVKVPKGAVLHDNPKALSAL